MPLIVPGEPVTPLIRKKIQELRRSGVHQEDRFLVSMPLYHAAGNGWARLFMNLGATLYMAPVDAPDELAASLTRHNITASVMTPALLSLVLNMLESSGQPMSYTLRWLLIGGKHFPAHQKQLALKHFGSVVYEYYGTTETGVNTIAEPVDLVRYHDSVGRAFDGNTVKIVNSVGAPLMPGQTGTVAIASYMNMSNYGDGSANALFLDGERYLSPPMPLRKC